MKQATEIQVLNLVDRVSRKLRIEDDLVECKSNWPDPDTIARQLGGHANSAAGQPIMWIIGVDEGAGKVPGATGIEVANWWSSVQSKFDDRIAPALEHLVVPVGDGSAVVALVFETDRAPYVVKKGGSDQGRFEREVPWRDGTRTRSAYRREVLRLLGPQLSIPPIDVVSTFLSAREELAKEPDPGFGEEGHGAHISLTLNGRVFFGPIASDLSVLPNYAMVGMIDFDPLSRRKDPPPGAKFQPRLNNQVRHHQSGSRRVDPHPLGVEAIHGGVYVRGPGEMDLGGLARLDSRFRGQAQRTQLLEVDLAFPVSGSTGAARLRIRMRRTDSRPGDVARWVWNRSN